MTKRQMSSILYLVNIPRSDHRFVCIRIEKGIGDRNRLMPRRADALFSLFFLFIHQLSLISISFLFFSQLTNKNRIVSFCFLLSLSLFVSSADLKSINDLLFNENSLILANFLINRISFSLKKKSIEKEKTD